MTDVDSTLDEDEIETPLSPEEVQEANQTLATRCKAAGIPLEEVLTQDEGPKLKVGMRCGRDTRWLYLWRHETTLRLLSLPFEKYVFLSDLEAICSYESGTIEAAIRPVGSTYLPRSLLYRSLFGIEPTNDSPAAQDTTIAISPTQDDLPHIEISPPSEPFLKLVWLSSRLPLTMKLTGCRVTTHDHALALLNKTAGSIFFQLDLLTEVPLTLERDRRPSRLGRKRRKKENLRVDLQYPKTEFDGAPLSLYWYGRSAAGMPLLQFLAFYQVIEFYFPIYSQSEAQRKLKTILKDPTFRGDRDTDVGKLLSAIHVTRSGAFGDERSQLRATLNECVDPNALRAFLESDPERKEFYSVSKSRATPYHKIPLTNPSVDLRNDVADRIYDIRCKIVHTKTDARDHEVELLLPFSKEAEQLSVDIGLAQYLAQLVLVAGSTPFNLHG